MLATVYERAWDLLDAIAPKIRGKGKTILDMTNPFLRRPDGFGGGLPADGPQSGIEVHQHKLNDPSTKCATPTPTPPPRHLVFWTLPCSLCWCPAPCAAA